jgi:hypothetical protein
MQSITEKTTVYQPVDIVLPQVAELNATIPVVEAWTLVDIIVLPA